jgi:hypothetical protein
MPSPLAASPNGAALGEAPHVDLVRFRNDGDEFHILWTARRAMRILWPQSGLVAVAVEGISERDRHRGRKIAAGLLVADTVEYYGAEDFEAASQIIVNQLKYSTTASSAGWPASDVQEVLAGFAERYIALAAQHGEQQVAAKYRFRFVSNRPLSAELAAILDAASRNNSQGLNKRAKKALASIRSACAMNGSELKRFLKTVEWSVGHAPRGETADALGQDARRVQPGLYAHATAALKEMVRGKALSDAAADPTIRRETVLRAFNLEDERDLYPAPSLFDEVPKRVRHRQEPDIASVVGAATTPLIISAPGGVGKSALAQALPKLLPMHSEAILFDGFAGGTYRAPSQARHRHDVGLVQIANELAARGLCDPLLPTPAPLHSYLRAFISRLAQAADTVRARNPDALVLIALDAADNSQMAADQLGERCFARDLLREDIPEGCRLVAMARPERLDLLDLPASVTRFQLQPFLRDETAAFVRQRFPQSSAHEIDEFHRLTFGNPRVQANQLSIASSLKQAIDHLGPQGLDVQGLIARQLDQSIQYLKGQEPGIDIDMLCTALAALPPLVPIDVIARVANIAPGAVLSFAADFAGGRPLMVHGESVQFRDEPVEHWFQSAFAPSQKEAGEFADRIEPLAQDNGYAAMALPRLLHSAGRYDRLVGLALHDAPFDSNDPVEKQQVILSRVKFAVRAALARSNFTDVAKLLIRAGEEVAASERQSAYLSDNADLVARLAGPQVVEDFVFRRRAGGGAWFGSSNAYNAAMLAADEHKATEARAYLRLAERWLDEWVRLPSEARQHEPLEAEDLAAMAFATVLCDGPEAGAQFLKRARHPQFAFDISISTGAKLLDCSRADLVIELIKYLGDGVSQKLAFVTLLWGRGHAIPKALLVALAKELIAAGKLPQSNRYEPIAMCEAGISVAEALARAGRKSQAEQVAKLADLRVPQHPFPDMRGQLAASLRLALLREVLGGPAISPGLLWRPRANPSKSGAKDEPSHEFEAMVAKLAPYYRLRAKALISKISDFDEELELTQTMSGSRVSFAGDYRDREVKSIRFVATLDAMHFAGAMTSERLKAAEKALHKPDAHIWPREAIRFMTLFGRDTVHGRDVLRLANAAAAAIEADREDAASTASQFASIARALAPFSPSDAAVYFAKGIEIADRVGDELHDRLWLLNSLGASSASANPTAEDAFRLVRAGELFHSINDHKFPWHDVFKAAAILHAPAAVAAASRLKSRRVVDFDETLAPALAQLAIQGRGGIEIQGALSIMDGYWRLDGLEQALKERGPGRRKAIIDYLATDQVHFGESAYRLKPLVHAARSHGLLDPELEALYEHRRQADENSNRDWSPGPEKPAPKFDFDKLLNGIDLLDPEALSAFFEGMERGPDHPSFNAILDDMRTRVAAPKWSQHVSALAGAEALDIPRMTEALEAASAAWNQSPAVEAGLKRLVTEIIRGRALEYARSTYLWTEYLPRLAALSGDRPEDLIRTIVSSGTFSIDQLGSGQLFSLAQRIAATLLAPESCLETLRFALGRLERIMREEDGDGPWDPRFDPGRDAAQSIAGLLWIALGTPEDEERWRATHAVRRLANLGEQAVIDALVDHARGQAATPYIDRRLPHYELHALDHLLIALARAAAEVPQAVLPYVADLKKWASRSNRHIFQRHHASRALIALHEAKAFQLSDAELAEASLLFEPAPAAAPIATKARRSSSVKRGEAGAYLPFDFDKNYSRPLSNAFGLPESQIEERIARIMVEEHKAQPILERPTDPRVGINYYRYRRQLTGIQNLVEYEAHHAAAMAAGELLELHRFADDYGEERWGSWLQEHRLTMESGAWLSDRRDPTPLKNSAAQGEGGGGQEWRWQIAAGDFEPRLLPSHNEILLWGDWTETSYSRSETVSIESALVSPETASDLLRALQISDRGGRFLPLAASDAEIRRPGFRLTGLVNESERRGGIDREDPLSGNIAFPPLRPGRSIARLLKLQCDEDGREWRSSKCPSLVFTPIVWGDPRPRRDDEESLNGSQLKVALTPLLKLLKLVNRDLFIMVKLRRRDSWGSESERGYYVEPYFKYFILRQDGRLEWLRGHRQIGRAVGRQAGE